MFKEFSAVGQESANIYEVQHFKKMKMWFNLHSYLSLEEHNNYTIILKKK